MTKTYATDFEEIKRGVSFEQVVPYSGIALKRVNDNQFKGNCPFCNGRESMTVTIAPRNPKYATGAFHCFVPKCGSGGDQIEFLSRVRGNPPRSKEGMLAAAKELSERFLASRAVSTVPATRSSPTVPKSDGCLAYGIIDTTAHFTDFGRDLYALRADEKALYDRLAKHILIHLRGMALIQCIRDMTAAGEEVNLTSLREQLGERGVNHPAGGKHPSIMRLWLAKAGVFVGSRWQIDDIRLQEVLGADPDMYRQLAGFTAEQRAFLRALANSGVTDPQPANEITKLAAATYGADSGDVARSFRDHVARCSDMMSPA
jgi:hypothetical protein